MRVSVTIHSDPATTNDAIDHRTEFEVYADALMEKVRNSPRATGTGILTGEDLHKMIAEMSEIMKDVPVLPEEAYQRESFYADYD